MGGLMAVDWANESPVKSSRIAMETMSRVRDMTFSWGRVDFSTKLEVAGTVNLECRSSVFGRFGGSQSGKKRGCTGEVQVSG